MLGVVVAPAPQTLKPSPQPFAPTPPPTQTPPPPHKKLKKEEEVFQTMDQHK